METIQEPGTLAKETLLHGKPSKTLFIQDSTQVYA
jgi:hypothetical protein